ncbi:MAG: rRNA methyltransferase, partial [Cyclobacteriaceae bacterium]|nr:rRNA methyltransferase [Cyclobacteriaceae bacterium]
MEIPQDFTDRFVDAFGPGEAASFKQAMAQPVPVSIRINPAKTTGRPALDPVPWNPNGFYLTDRPSFTADPWFHAGAYYAQEASSMVVGHLMKQWVDGEMGGHPLRVLDLCGA